MLNIKYHNMKDLGTFKYDFLLDCVFFCMATAGSKYTC